MFTQRRGIFMAPRYLKPDSKKEKAGETGYEIGYGSNGAGVISSLLASKTFFTSPLWIARSASHADIRDDRFFCKGI